MSTSLTLLVPCKNECHNIRACIESFRELADEILIADSGSTDGTLEIVKRLGGCRIIEREYRTSGDFKNWAIPQSQYPWVLLVDADERVTPALAAEVRKVLADDPPLDGFWIYRDNHFLGKPVRYGGCLTDCCLRLFRRDIGRYHGPSDHGEVLIDPRRTGRLRNRLLHYTYRSYDQYFQKFQRYTTLQAQQWHAAGKKPSVLKMFFNPPLRFLRDYVLRLGFLDGAAGLQMAMLTAFYSYAKQARLWELENAGNGDAQDRIGSAEFETSLTSL